MGTTVLLADDSITIQKVVGIIFANEDYELVVVDNGTAALEKAREIRPALMLVDALMPDMSGYEVSEEVRRDPALGATPLLLLVGAFEPFDEERARTCGIDDYITKPFESQNLLEKVHGLLELGATRTSAASVISPEPLPVETAVQETASEPEFVMPETTPEPAFVLPEAEPEPAPGASANLIEPFKNFVHLGAGDSGGGEEVREPEPQAPVLKEPDSEGVIVLSSVDIIEAAPEDDPWGTFDEEEPIHFGEVVDEDQQAISSQVEEIESYALLEEPAEEEAGTAEPVELGTLSETPSQVCVPTADESFVFADEPESVAYSGFESPASAVIEEPAGEKICLGEISAPAIETPAREAWESVSPDVAVVSEAQAVEETELSFAPEEEYVPAEQALEEAIAPADGAASAAGSATVSLTEEQLAQAIARVSREIIEKIAWDVVPDLAETIIREEIRRIKEGIGR